jgi:hypothetical protein
LKIKIRYFYFLKKLFLSWIINITWESESHNQEKENGHETSNISEDIIKQSDHERHISETSTNCQKSDSHNQDSKWLSVLDVNIIFVSIKDSLVQI